MARDRANIRTDMLGDDHYRELTHAEQWLYKLLLIHPSLSYAGVADWRPGKLATTASDLTAADVRRIGAGLQAKYFIYVDEATEEVFVRSFVKHDGLLKQYRLPVSMANDYAGIASREIRSFFIHELQRIFDKSPELKCWEIDRVKSLLEGAAANMKELSYGDTLPITFAEGYGKGYADTYAIDPDQGYGLRTATATSTATHSKECVPVEAPSVGRGLNGTRIPHDFKATTEMLAWALENTPNVDPKTATNKFKAHYRSVAGRNQFRTDWTAAWELWMTSDQERIAPPKQPNAPTSAWDRKGIHT